MNKYKILAAVFLLIPLGVQAQSGAIAGSQSQSQAQAGAGAAAIINIGSGAGSTGGGAGTQSVGGTSAPASSPFIASGGGSGGGGGAGGSASANNAGNSQNIQFNSVGSDLGDLVPAVVAPSLVSTLSGTCSGSVSSGIGFSGFGGSLGRTFEDKECQARLNANSLNALGMSAVAYEVMCATPSVLAADGRMAKPQCADNQAAIADAEEAAFYNDGSMDWIVGISDQGNFVDEMAFLYPMDTANAILVEESVFGDK